MRIERKQDYSVYYWLRDIFSEHLDFITINDGYPDGELERPSITVEADEVMPVEYEMGSRERRNIRTWLIDIIANNKDQRDEFAYEILENLRSGIPVFDYDEGFPPDVSPTQLGLLRATSIVANPIRIFPELVEKMYWRSTIKFLSEYNPF